MVLGGDEGFAAPLATALRSLCDANSRHWPLDLHVLADRITEGTRRQVAASLPAGSATLHWIDVDLERFRSYDLPSGLTPVSFARLEIPRLFHGRASRVLYLDADVLVLGDLADLSQANLHGAPVGAVPDYYIDPQLKRSVRADWMAEVPQVDAYFNSGVLLLDIEACVRRDLMATAVDYLRSHPSARFPDQDALNVACAGAWHPLDTRYNFQGHLDHRVDRMAAAERPAVVHFVTAVKPWLPAAAGRHVAMYEQIRNRTLFRRSASSKLYAALNTFVYRARNRVFRLGRLLSAAGQVERA